MGIMVRERAHECGFMEARQGEAALRCEQLMAEPQLPCGWEKCLDLKSGLIYFKDWNSGTLTYRDPRRSGPVAAQRIGLLSISLSPEDAKPASDGSKGWTRERGASPSDAADHSLELSLNLPGTSPSRQEGSVCTVEKVRSALERSQWLKPASSLRLESSSPSTSQSSSECFTSPSATSYQGDDDEVQQPRECRDSGAKSGGGKGKRERSGTAVMVAVGCKRCLMYVMLSKAHPSCPKCGTTDVLLDLPAPTPKRPRTSLPSPSPSWSWSSA